MRKRNTGKTAFRIAGIPVGYGHEPFVIAEAGVNHNGKIALAMKLIDVAARAGAHAVKFQTFRAHQVVLPSGEMAAYQKKNLGKTEKQIEMIKKLELPERSYPRLIAHSKRRKIIFFSTPHGSFASVDFLAKLHMPAYKIGSGDLTNLPLLRYAAHLGKPMIISTGMGTMAETQEAVQTILRAGNRQLAVLHATTNYPCPPNEVNLGAMQTMMRALNVPVGYSDHTEDATASVAAVALGACIIEKHFTLSHKLSGPDHIASLEPDALRRFIAAVKGAYRMLGNGQKRPNASERIIMPLVRRSLVTTKTIRKGEKFTKHNLDIKRPGTGLAPKLYDTVLGKRAARDLSIDALLKNTDYA